MRAFTQFLVNRSGSDIRNLALATATLIFSVLVVKVLPLFDSWDPILQILLAAVSLGALVTGIEWLLQFIRTRRVCGEWVYVSSAENWGLASITLVGSTLNYEVHLYRTENDIRDAIAGNPPTGGALLGHTTAASADYLDGALNVHYIVGNTNGEYDKRSGFLKLVPHSTDPAQMTGYWSSTRDGSSGTLHLTRAEKLDDLCAAHANDAECNKDLAVGESCQELPTSDAPAETCISGDLAEESAGESNLTAGLAQAGDHTIEKLPGVQRVHVIGLGLIGGSIALRLRDLGYRVTGTDPLPVTCAAAENAGIAASAELPDLAQIDLLVLAAPTPVNIRMLQLPGLGQVTLVLDVSSVKADIVAAAREAGLTNFVGAHPMAGTENSGFAAASVDLLQGATWALCPSQVTAVQSLREAIDFAVNSFGAQAVICPPDAHDQAVADVSHLPHALALTLLARPGRGKYPQLAARLAAGSFRDGTRVARGSGRKIAQMLDRNAEPLATSLRGAVADLEELKRLLEVQHGEAENAAEPPICPEPEGDSPASVPEWIYAAQGDAVSPGEAHTSLPLPQNEREMNTLLQLGERGWVVTALEGEELQLER